MVIIYGPKWLWAEMAMGRYCHGPKWLWAEMTSYLHILRRSISDHHLKLLCEMPSVIFYTNRNMPLHPKLWGRAGIMTFQFSVPCNKSTPLSQETLEVKPMIFALPHWGKDNAVKTWHLPCTAAAGTKSYCTLIWISPQGPHSTQ